MSSMQQPKHVCIEIMSKLAQLMMEMFFLVGHRILKSLSHKMAGEDAYKHGTRTLSPLCSPYRFFRIL